ncbi:hypothetical protein D9Q98_002520 [Chlorella vulgaris]|uniref:uracil phosphoribosyltransferase n=1 Tax=Chlorella vulgaris TaxID=3077 RepID=A0A9D4TTY8_CHLVU|nr:hypothetical protein D9Q98_002520 [Chlorella vulgaris]
MQTTLRAQPSASLRPGRLQLRRQRGARLFCAAMAPPKQQMLIYVPPHPLVKHWLAVLRTKQTPSSIFRAAASELGRILIYEAAREWLPTVDGQVETPLGVADATFVDIAQPIKVVPILRAGLVLVEQTSMVLPASQTYHVGYVRNDETLEASCYLNKLPPSFTAEDRILVSDPMLATGGTLMQVLDDIVARGASPSMIRVISIVCAPPALKLLGEKFPGLTLFTAMIDPELNDQGFIVPGLGDAGDRVYNTEA